MKVHLPDAAATARLGASLGRLAGAGDIIGLSGPLGAGKTCFIRGLAQGLMVPPATRITSPTFTLINEYRGRLTLYHVDLYRLADEAELQELGLLELCEAGGVLAVEWIDRFPDALPGDRLLVSLSLEEQGRTLSARAEGERSARLYAGWAQRRSRRL